MKYRLGLDVGTNSLGWSVLKLDENGEPCAIEAAGSRIFAEGRDAKTRALAATRREKRSARRRRDRFKQRQRFLLDELTRAGLFPKNADERKKLQKLNPLELRAKALSERLKPYEVGRALFHLNQRRGYKSNRKDRSEESVGVVSRSARLLLQQMGLIEPEISTEKYRELSRLEKKQVRQQEAEARVSAMQKLSDEDQLTYGSFLRQRQRDGKSVRARPGAGADGKLYDVYPTRELYEDEFGKIWQAQAAHHPSLMTADARQRIRRAIFHQRPLRPQKRGKCAYLPGEDRTFRAMPSFQRYRIYQEVNSLEWQDGFAKEKVINYPEARDAIVHLLETVTAKSGQVTFGMMKKELKKRGIAEGNFKFNFETAKRKGFDGNLTSNLMQSDDRIGPAWHDWSIDQQDEFIDVILNGTPEHQERDRKLLEGSGLSEIPDGTQDDEQVRRFLMKRFSISEYTAENCLNAPLKDDTAHISSKAARLMLEKMREGIVEQKAAIAVAQETPEFKNPSRAKGDDGKYLLLEWLPYYGEAFRDDRHIILGTANPKDDDRTRWGGVTNPTVHIALNQIRQVVNELIEQYGHPNSISIELGRELPAGADKRREIEKEQSENQKRNQKYDAKLRELGQNPSASNRLRLFLWEELNKDPNGRCCPFSGKKIGRANLFDASIEIEHLIPFSDSLDDSRANKIICYRQANRDKGNRTPHEAFGTSPPGYDWSHIYARAEELPDSKRWRFQQDAREIWMRNEDDFTSRHLNDTRYIGRLAREYLESICHTDRIDVVTGRLTSLLRHHWGLEKVLDDGSGMGRKNRDDHRHHAVDAIVVGMTNRSMLQKVSTVARRLEESETEGAQYLNRLFAPLDGRKGAIDPWEGFREDVFRTVRSIVVSHKVKRKKLRMETKCITDGQLHNDTAYGIARVLEKDGLSKVVTRKSITAIAMSKNVKKKIELIRDPRLREKFSAAFVEAEVSSKGTGSKAILDFAQRNKIRRLRCIQNLSVIPILDDTGKAYKAYEGDSNWGIEIYCLPRVTSEKAGKWKGVVISRFAANQKSFKPGHTFRPHPAARMVMRLQINDCVQMQKIESDNAKFYRLQKFDRSGRMEFVELHEANVDRRNRSKDDDFKYTYASASLLQSRNAKKIHISPTGRVSYEKRRPPRSRRV